MEDTTILIIILIAVAVMMSEDRITTALVASIALNISLMLGADPTSVSAESPTPRPPGASDLQATLEGLAPDAIDNLYGPQYNAWSAHSRSYDMYPEVKPHVGSDCAENDYSVDTLGALITQKRGSRDKRAMDGAITKGVDYYKYHYGSELEEEEAKPWWGRHEY